jgi:phage head maturation protease
LSNVVFNINHDSDKLLARNSKTNGKGSLLLSVDDKGLFFDAIPTDTSYSRDLIENMNERYNGKCSIQIQY